ncbi:MAG TPA: phosphate ABC transporter permease PstA [Phototrophicaceae bacterium]|nr:phosphate ABC transporter permease PstA [Phototrophicaceae bacterium]
MIGIDEGVFKSKLVRRQQQGIFMRRLYAASFGVAIVALILLLLTIVNEAFGYVTLVYKVEPETLTEQPFDELNREELVTILITKAPGQLPRLVQMSLTSLDLQAFAATRLDEALPGKVVSSEFAHLSVKEIPAEQRPVVLGQILTANLDEAGIRDLIETAILEPTVAESWPLFEGLLNRKAIEQSLVEKYPDVVTRPELRFKSWLRGDLLTNSMDANPLLAGVRTALIGTIYLLVIVVLTAFPVGIGAAIYLEEYADPTRWYNRLIETNIRNLAGVPSIIYGMLGLQLLVRFMGERTNGGLGITSGEILGVTDGTGRNLIAAGLTLGLLVLPVIIINAQEAIRAVPPSFREGSYGLGATKWQTIWKTVLPSAMPGIMTGIILSLSRAVGETAPLVVVGASTYVVQDPTLFSRFTALPIQIYNWTSRPQAGFRELAAGGIVILLVLLVIINAVAFVLRSQARRRLQS